MFIFINQELVNLKPQNVIASSDWGGRRSMPLGFCGLSVKNYDELYASPVRLFSDVLVFELNNNIITFHEAIVKGVKRQQYCLIMPDRQWSWGTCRRLPDKNGERCTARGGSYLVPLIAYWDGSSFYGCTSNTKFESKSSCTQGSQK